MRYRLLDHTSDIKVQIYGRDLPELFANAAYCIGDLMLDIDKVEPVEERKLEISSPDLPELFLDWFRELLFLFSTRGFAVRRAAVREITGTQLETPGDDTAFVTADETTKDSEPPRHRDGRKQEDSDSPEHLTTRSFSHLRKATAVTEDFAGASDCVPAIPVTHLSAVLHGQPYDPARHGLKIEVKTPTYHEYNLERRGETWRATLILDV